MTRSSSLNHLPSIAGASLFLVLAAWVCKFENVADLKFWASDLTPLAGAPFALYNKIFLIEDKYEIHSCEELGDAKLLRDTLNPILFKGCIPNPQNLTVEEDLVTFPGSTTNIFPSCGRDKEIERSFVFQAKNGDVQHIVERIPCSSNTLEEKIRFHQDHDPIRDGPHTDVSVRSLDMEDTRVLEHDFKQKGFLPAKFSFSKLAPVVVLAHFFGSGTCPIPYHHSHMDRFFSFGIQTPKVWDLINPKYHDSFEWTWSGNAVILTKEKVSVPHVIVEQEPGDILFIPPWWLHKASYKDGKAAKQTKSVNFNLHIMTSRSLVGVCAHVFMNLCGNTKWFYSNDINRKAFAESGLSYDTYN